MTSAAEARAQWLAYLHSTEPADRVRAESGLRALYTAAGFPQPTHILWFDSPCAASWTLAALVPKEDWSSSRLLAPGVLSQAERERMDKARAELCERVGVRTWDGAVAALGRSRLGAVGAGLDPRDSFAPAFLEARFAMVDDVSSLFQGPRNEDDLTRAEAHFWGPHRGVLHSPSHCPTTDFLIRRSFYDQHSFSSLADDVARIGDREPPPLLRAAAEVAHSAGLWWPYEHGVVICDRPSEIRLNDRQVPHREDGPAVVFRDGWQVYAWNGKAVPERWIMQTATVRAGEYRGFDPSFTAWAKAKGRSPRAPIRGSKAKSILSVVLPSDHAARLDQLRAHAGGRLPRLERYIAGAREEVWAELIALDASVREEPHATDALAVAYETMHRVETNVRMLVERLTALGYVFGPRGSTSGAISQLSGLVDAVVKAHTIMFGRGGTPKARRGESQVRAHVPPGRDAQRTVADFEKKFGPLPLSLHAFYEVVGEVNLIGHHPALDPLNNPIATDPLVVYGLDEGALEYDDEDEGDNGGAPVAITIAPDDLHKANISGGDPYTMAVPDLRADGELLDERHRLFFVSYLRLCFEFAGFAGYEGRGTTPPEIQSLKTGLLSF